jgi:hypothetical protein
LALASPGDEEEDNEDNAATWSRLCGNNRCGPSSSKSSKPFSLPSPSTPIEIEEEESDDVAVEEAGQPSSSSSL